MYALNHHFVNFSSRLLDIYFPLVTEASRKYAVSLVDYMQR